MRNWLLGVGALIILAACGTPLASADGSHILLVNGVGYGNTHEAGATFHWEAPNVPVGTSVTFAERSQSWTGQGYQDCEGGLAHWISNENNLVQSGCVEGPVTTPTTLPNVTTTTSTTLPNATTTTCPDCGIITVVITGPSTTTSTTLPPTPNTFAVPGGTTTTTQPTAASTTSTTVAPTVSVGTAPVPSSIPPITNPATVVTTVPAPTPTTPVTIPATL